MESCGWVFRKKEYYLLVKVSVRQGYVAWVCVDGTAEAQDGTFLKYRMLTQRYPERTRGSPPTIQPGVHTLPIPIVGGRWSPLADEYGSENLIFCLKMSTLACLLLLLLAGCLQSPGFENDHFPDLVRSPPPNQGRPHWYPCGCHHHTYTHTGRGVGAA